MAVKLFGICNSSRWQCLSVAASTKRNFDGFATLIGADHEKIAPSVDRLNAVTASDVASSEV